MLASSSESDDTVRIWDLKTGQPVAVLDSYTSLITSVAFSPDGKNLALGLFGDKAQVWNIETKKRLFAMWERGHNSTGNICYSPDGKRIALGFSRLVHLFDAQSGKKMQSFRVQKENRKSKRRGWLRSAMIAFSPDGQILATSAYVGQLHLWDLKTGNLFRALECDQRQVHAVAFSPDGKMLAVAVENTIQLWDWHTGIQKFVLHGYYGVSSSPNLTFSSNGKLLASAGGDRGLAVRIWNLESKDIASDLRGHTASVKGVIFNKQGTLLASCAHDHTARLWDVEKRKELVVLPHKPNRWVDNVIFNPDGNLLLTTSGFNLLFWGVLNQTTR
jgi:WD40 repeat protein